MKILHGTWIPDSTDDFIQSGGFYIWVETDQLRSTEDDRHPRQLPHEELAEFLESELGVKGPSHHSLSELIAPTCFLLPTEDNIPLPSLELARYLEDESSETFDWQYWLIDCYEVGTYIGYQLKPKKVLGARDWLVVFWMSIEPQGAHSYSQQSTRISLGNDDQIGVVPQWCHQLS